MQDEFRLERNSKQETADFPTNRLRLYNPLIMDFRSNRKLDSRAMRTDFCILKD